MINHLFHITQLVINITHNHLELSMHHLSKYIFLSLLQFGNLFDMSAQMINIRLENNIKEKDVCQHF